MKMYNEKKETWYKYDMDFSNDEAEVLKDYALKHIINDSDVLINYAVNKLLREYVDTYSETRRIDDVQKVSKNLKKPCKKVCSKKGGCKCK